MWTLEYPGYLLLFSFVPIGIWIRHFWKGRGGGLTFSFTVWDGDSFSVRNPWLFFLLGLSHTLFWSGISFLILSLAGPAFYKPERVYLSRGIDIMIVLDESPSMAAMDFETGNRFQAAKKVIREFVNGRDNDPIGLVSFGKDAALRMPPTLDYKELQRQLGEIKLMELGDGTAIGMGIAVAALHLKESTAPSKIIILLTDGENNSGEIPPETAAEIAVGLGIKIYTIGIGTVGEVPLTFTNPDTGIVYQGTYKSGFDEELLKSMAHQSRGEYFAATSLVTLESIFKTIDSMETRGQKVKMRIETIPKYRIFIILGLLLILSDYLFRKAILKEVLP